MQIYDLAFGKSTSIINFVPMDKSYGRMERGRRDILTDGHSGDPEQCYGGTWVHFYRGIGRRITVDLENACAVSGFKCSFLHNRKMGIYCPEEVRLLLSDDGRDYYEIGKCESPYKASYGECVIAEYSFSDETKYRARYAALEFNVEVNAFCDSIKIFGTECAEIAERLCGVPSRIENRNAYAKRGTAGANDICLLYYGYYPANDRVARMDKQAILPYVAYLDSEGKITGTMFDGVMLLIVQGACPSGGSLGYFGKGNVYSDWQYTEDVLFERGYNLDALNEAVGDMKKALSLDEQYRYKVYLQAPTPKISYEVFGDYNGDGIEEKLLTVDDCIDAYCHYADGVQRRFDSYGFDNLELAGWFWGNESLSRSENDNEEEFAAGCVKAMHDRGYKVIFIPYYQAGGSEKAEKTGFDCTTMQPGLSFNVNMQADPEGSMEDFTELCRQYGFGIEIEIHQGVRAKETENRVRYTNYFLQYLRTCVKNGMMTDTVHTYYQCAGPGVYHDCCVSKIPEQRALYDLVYKFIKGTLTLEDIEKTAQNALNTFGIADGVAMSDTKKDADSKASTAHEENTNASKPEESLNESCTCSESEAESRDTAKIIKAKSRKKLIYTATITAVAAGIAYSVYKSFKRKKN